LHHLFFFVRWLTGSPVVVLRFGDGLRLEGGVELAGGLDHFPGAGEARRHHETVAGPEGRGVAGFVAHHDLARQQMAELVFDEGHGPAAGLTFPDPGGKLAGGVGEEIPHRLVRRSRPDTVGVGAQGENFGRGAVEGDDTTYIHRL
jgi:hypothetical protein